jgi:hypothetical protein
MPIFGFPLYPTTIAPPVYWKPLMKELVALYEKESV